TAFERLVGLAPVVGVSDGVAVAARSDPADLAIGVELDAVLLRRAEVVERKVLPAWEALPRRPPALASVVLAGDLQGLRGGADAQAALREDVIPARAQLARALRAGPAQPHDLQDLLDAPVVGIERRAGEAVGPEARAVVVGLLEHDARRAQLDAEVDERAAA